VIARGHRLRQERIRIGMSQDGFAALAGQSRKSQINYEKGDRSPDIEYLAAIQVAGADVLYILTGRRERPLSRLDDHERLRLAVEAVEEGLTAIRRTLPPTKRAELILAAYDLMAEPEQAKGKVIQLLRLVA